MTDGARSRERQDPAGGTAAPEDRELEVREDSARAEDSSTDDRTPRARRYSVLLESLVIFIACWVIAMLRMGSSGLRGVMWAEDGPIVLQDAFTGHGFWAIFVPYRGYAIVPPRLVGVLVSFLPISAQGVAVVGSAVALQAAIAVFAFHVVLNQSHRRLAGLIVALSVAAVPQGLDVEGVLVNVQWYLVFAACIAPLWRPRTRFGRAASIVVLSALILNNPLGLVPVGVAGIAWFFRRGGYRLALFLVGVGCSIIQLVIMSMAPPRTPRIVLQFNPILVTITYVHRVAGDGVFGVGRYLLLQSTSRGPLPGLMVLLAVLVLFALAASVEGWKAILLPGALVALSWVTFGVPIELTDMARDYNADNGRFCVGPTLLLTCAITLLFVRAMEPYINAGYWRTVAYRMVAAGLLVAVAFGMVTTWAEPRLYRQGGSSWAAEVSRGRSECSQKSDQQVAVLNITPAHWTVKVPCALLRS